MGKTVTHSTLTIRYQAQNTAEAKTFEVPRGTLPLDIIAPSKDITQNPVVGCCIEGSCMALSHPLKYSGTLTPIYLESELGRRIYRRSLSFLLAMTAKALFPENTLRISHSLGDGFFYTFDKPVDSIHGATDALAQAMQELIHKNQPIHYQVLPYQQAVNYLQQEGLNQALQILNYRNDATIPVYLCNGYMDISYEPLVASTGVLSCFSIRPYEEGLLLRFPRSNNPHNIAEFTDNPLLYDVYTESKAWGTIMGISSVGDVNERIMNHQESELIGLAESLQQRKINTTADQIHAAYTKGSQVRVVFVAGPSSSGKTTFTNKLSLALQVLGLHPHTISLDSYYLPKAEVPKGPDGKPDLEAITSLDLPLFQAHMQELLAGRPVEIPDYSFAKGQRLSGKLLHPQAGDIYLVEGIHGLNPTLSALVPKNQQLRIFISALTQINLDGQNRISTTDNRLIRRMVRDNQFRGASPEATMDMWDSVRHGEKHYIFPYQNEADVAFNSSLDYELSVLKFFAEPLLKEIKPLSPHYPRAMRLLTILANFYPISAEKVPKNSIIREFIGGLRL